MKKLIAVLALVFVVGCQSLQETADTWVGSNINDLIATNGAPDQIIDNGSEGKIMVWRHGSSFTMPGSADTTYLFGQAHTTYYPGHTVQRTDIVTFWVNPESIIYRASAVSR